MSTVNFEILRRIAVKDENVCMNGGYGFVIARNGDVWQLLKPFHHGAVIALLEPLRASESGYEIPEGGCFDVYKFQDFELENQDLGYLRVGIGMFNRISIGDDVKPTKEQVASLEKWLYNNDMLDDKFSTEVNECRGRIIINAFKKLIADDQIKSVRHLRGLDLELIEPKGIFDV